jgi:hypothetical protein
VEVFGGIGDGDAVDTVFNFASVAVILAFDTGGVIAAFGRSGFINNADRLGISMIAGDDPLALVTHPLFIPHDRFEEPLERSGRDPLIECHRFGIFSLDIAEQSPHIDCQQLPPFDTCKTVREIQQKPAKQFSKRCDILELHETTFRGFCVKRLFTRRVVSFSTCGQGQQVQHPQALAHNSN